MKTRLDYEKLQNNVPGCSPATTIPTLLDCEAAHKSLGLTYIPIFSGNSTSLPRFCSVREDGQGTNGEHLHWNIAAAGVGRPDLSPVCYKSSNYGCAWPRPTNTATDTATETGTTTHMTSTTTTPTPQFMMLADGSPGCAPGSEIFTQEVCRDAVVELGLDPSPSFQGKWESIPRFCSFAGQTASEHMHFNLAEYGQAHVDYRPICYSSQGKFWLLREGNVHANTSDKVRIAALQGEVAMLKEEEASLLRHQEVQLPQASMFRQPTTTWDVTVTTWDLITTTTLETTRMPIMTTVSTYAEGWYAGLVDEQCGQACARRGLICTETALVAHNAEVDDPAEVKALIQKLTGIHMDQTACTAAFGKRLDAPGWSQDICLVSAHQRTITHVACGVAAIQPHTGFRRLCYCHEFDT